MVFSSNFCGLGGVGGMGNDDKGFSGFYSVFIFIAWIIDLKTSFLPYLYNKDIHSKEED